MNKLKLFANLTRINRPIGFMLLFWPCSWGLTIGFVNNSNVHEYLVYLILFFLGSVLMRSAGCIFNDIVDKDFDKKVKRTKERPLAAKIISVNHALFYVAFLCFFAFLILIQFNTLTIFLGLGSMFLAFSYPFMKRITYWPQLFLGITFNWGILMSWTSMGYDISFDILVLYASAIFWTLGYDTIYGAQDMSDDEIIGLKSTSIKFKKNIKFFVGSCYLINALLLSLLFKQYFGVNFFTFSLIIFFLTLIYQIKIFEKVKQERCLAAFRFNNVSGLMLFLSINLL